MPKKVIAVNPDPIEVQIGDTVYEVVKITADVMAAITAPIDEKDSGAVYRLAETVFGQPAGAFNDLDMRTVSKAFMFVAEEVAKDLKPGNAAGVSGTKQRT